MTWILFIGGAILLWMGFDAHGTSIPSDLRPWAIGVGLALVITAAVLFALFNRDEL